VLALKKIQALYWIRVEKVNTFVLFLTSKEMLLFFSLFSVILAVSLPHMAFIILRYIHFVHIFFRAFIMKGCWILSMAFSDSIKIICDFYPLFYLCAITFMDLHILNHHCIPGIILRVVEHLLWLSPTQILWQGVFMLPCFQVPRVA
jgi:hypothetical protein